MSVLRASCLVACLVVLAGCMGAPPVSVHPLDTFDDHRAEWAIVIVDLDLETSTSMINSSTLILPTEPTQEVFAIYADVGKPFKLKRLSVPARPGYSADLTFPGAKELAVDRTGIYYYGRVVQRGADVVVDYEFDASVIARATDKYPHMFRRLEAVNFTPPVK